MTHEETIKAIGLDMCEGCPISYSDVLIVVALICILVGLIIFWIGKRKEI